MKSEALSDIGKERAVNQDFVFNSDKRVGNLPNLYIVADGMGGHKAGDFASKCAVNTFIDYVEKSDLSNPVLIIKEGVSIANKAVIAESRNNPDYEGMGTTLVVASIHEGTLFVANVGDSRLYLVNDNIRQITKDHSLVEEMVDIGEIDKESARKHINKNIITKAIGLDEDLKVDFFELEISDKDIVLLSTDGLTNMVEDKKIFEIIHNDDEPIIIAENLVNEANNNGGRDNISVVIII